MLRHYHSYIDLPKSLPLFPLTGAVLLVLYWAGWLLDRTLLASGWYPASADTPEKRLAYYARQFPIVEVDSTYYGPPNEQTTKLWAQRTPAGFVFNIKAFSLLTGHPTKVSAIYKDLRPETDKKNVYPGDLAPQTYEEVWSRSQPGPHRLTASWWDTDGQSQLPIPDHVADLIRPK